MPIVPGQTTYGAAGDVSKAFGGGSGMAMGAVASSVISGIGSIAQGFITAQRYKNTSDFNAKMSGLDERMGVVQGKMMRLAADVEIRNIRKRATTLLSNQRAMYANAGVKMQGSPASVMLDSLKEAEIDVIFENINADYNIGLNQYKIGNTRTQADMYRNEGRAAQSDAWQNVGKSILTMGNQYLINA